MVFFVANTNGAKSGFCGVSEVIAAKGGTKLLQGDNSRFSRFEITLVNTLEKLELQEKMHTINMHYHYRMVLLGECSWIYKFFWI